METPALEYAPLISFLYEYFIAFQWCGIHSVSIALSGQYEWWTNTVLSRRYNERSLSYCHHLDVSNGKMVTCDLSTACFELLRDILLEEHQAERGHSFHRVCLHLGIFVSVWGFEREGLGVLIRVCLLHCCHYIPFGLSCWCGLQWEDCEDEFWEMKALWFAS